jgi:hypothetical protein
VKTGVQRIAKALKTLDSGFRRNDGKEPNRFFHTFPSRGGNFFFNQHLPPLWGGGIFRFFPHAPAKEGTLFADKLHEEAIFGSGLDFELKEG